ncbi:HEAT repeat domain-containing protein [Candidatus Leptofilum sp.]|uniref:HEAT repeat domain-containing protein n=1 Tax=Candidatus Leptofilum sp. TaxID=3241576 RepID=UPI003B5CAD26
MQSFQNWQFDTISFVVGLLLGLVGAYSFLRIRPFLRRRLARLTDWVRERITYLRSGVAVRFLAETAAYANTHHLLGNQAGLDALFVPPRLQAPLDDPALLPEDRAATAVSYLWPEWAGGVGLPPPPTMSVEQLLRNGRRVIIAGEPGVGKSTLLAHLAYRCAVATADGRDAALVNTMPVLVHLAELGVAAGGELEDAEAILANAMQKRANPLTAPGIKDLLHQKLKAGQVLLLLDGWDALPVPKRPNVAEWLEALLRKYKQTQTFVAAGLTGHGLLLELDFTRSTLMPWRLGEVDQFSEQATQALSVSKPPRLPYFWQPGQITAATTLNYFLRGLSQVADDPKRPLPLCDLLQNSLSMLAGQPAVDPQHLTFWQQLAFIMLSDGKMALNRAEITAVAEEMCQDADGELDRSAANQLQKSVKQTPIFVTWGNDSVSFCGTLWRDFLAAGYLVAQQDEATAAAHLHDSSWAQVLRFYVAQQDPAALAKQLLQGQDNSPSRESVFQVASWLPLTAAKGEWRRQTMILLGQMIRSGPSFTQVIRQRAAAALAQSNEPGVITFVSQLLERSDPFLRQLGTAALPRLGDDRAIGLLAKMISDGDELVRQTAVYGLLFYQHHPLAEQPLLGALIGEDETLSQIVAEGLALNGSRGVEILLEALGDDDIQVRRAAVLGLALLDSTSIEKQLIQVERHDDEWFVRSAANGALETLRARRKVAKWEPPNPADQRWLTMAFRENGRIVPDGAAAMPFLVQLISESDDNKLRASAATLLSHLPALDAMPALETAVRDTDFTVSEAAFTTLCHLRRAYG